MPRVISSVEIQNFRGVREGHLGGLSQLNILVGPNNAGKSTCLEAIAVAGEADTSKIAALLLRRGGPPHDALMHLTTNGAKFSDFCVEQNRTGNHISLESRLIVNAPGNMVIPDGGQVHEALRQGLTEPMLRIIIVRKHKHSSGNTSLTYIDAMGKRSAPFVGAPLPSFPVNLVDVEAVRATGALEDAYSRIERAGKVDTVIRALQRSMPGLTDMRILKSDRDFVLHTFCGSGKTRPVPAYVAGDGFKRFLELAAATLDANDGVILLEEPETYQHPRYLKELATLLLLAAKSGTQVVLSTHSMELIDLLLHAAEAEGLEYPVIFRLRLLDGKLSAVRLLREQAIVARDELLEDLRA